MSPQKRFHQRVIRHLSEALDSQVPENLSAVDQMDVKLGHRERPRPDISIIEADSRR